jgi:hypothetical protein
VYLHVHPTGNDRNLLFVEHGSDRWMDMPCGDNGQGKGMGASCWPSLRGPVTPAGSWKENWGQEPHSPGQLVWGAGT